MVSHDLRNPVTVARGRLELYRETGDDSNLDEVADALERIEELTTDLLTLVRHVHRAWNRTREFNFRLGGLLGRDLHGRTVGVVGTGRIGTVFVRLMRGFGCPVLVHDVVESPECVALGARYVPLDTLLAESDVISLHVPLLPSTHHLVNAASIARMRRGVVIINTSRGALIDSEALVAGITSGHVGAVGLDVYEEEEGKFFRDLSDHVMDDAVLARLTTFPNVLVTGHQAFFTREAMTTIAETTIANLADHAAGREGPNVVRPA